MNRVSEGSGFDIVGLNVYVYIGQKVTFVLENPEFPRGLHQTRSFLPALTFILYELQMSERGLHVVWSRTCRTKSRIFVDLTNACNWPGVFAPYTENKSNCINVGQEVNQLLLKWITSSLDFRVNDMSYITWLRMINQKVTLYLVMKKCRSHKNDYRNCGTFCEWRFESVQNKLESQIDGNQSNGQLLLPLKMQAVKTRKMRVNGCVIWSDLFGTWATLILDFLWPNRYSFPVFTTHMNGTV